MALTMTRFTEDLDNEGKVAHVVCGLSWQNDDENFAATVTLLPSDITDGTSLDDKVKKELFRLAANKFLGQVTNAVSTVK